MRHNQENVISIQAEDDDGFRFFYLGKYSDDKQQSMDILKLGFCIKILGYKNIKKCLGNSNTILTLYEKMLY